MNNAQMVLNFYNGFMACVFYQDYLLQLVWRVILKDRTSQAKFNRALERKGRSRNTWVHQYGKTLLSSPCVQHSLHALERAIIFC